MSSTLPSLAHATKSGNFLASEAELSLIAKYQETGCAGSLNKLLLNYSNMCMKIAHGYSHRFDVDDTYQDCMECLILSVRSFNPAFGVPFFTYAYRDVKQAVSMRMIKKWSCVTTPGSKGFYKAFRKMPEFVKGAEFSQGNAVLLAEKLDVKTEDVIAAYQIYQSKNCSLDAFVGGVSVIDSMEDESSPEHLVIEADSFAKRGAAVKSRMASLNPKETIVIKLRHLTEQPQTLHEVAAQIGVSAERVRQIESKAKSKLRMAA